MTVIKPMDITMIKDIEKLEQECFTAPWSEEGLKAELYKDTSVFYTAYENDRLLGYAGMCFVCGEAYIDNIAVFKFARNKKVASTLLTTLINYAKRYKGEFITLEVRESNTPAISLYKKFCFNIVGKRKNFYSKPTEDAYIMTLNIQ